MSRTHTGSRGLSLGGDRLPTAAAAPRERALRIVLPLLTAAAFVLLWDLVVVRSGNDVFPRPHQVVLAVREVAVSGRLLNYVVSSLFRVTIGFVLAAAVGVPFGLLLGWFARLFQAFNPLMQVLRPISPIAWIPIAILLFGVDDRSPIFLIFLASFFRSPSPRWRPSRTSSRSTCGRRGTSASRGSSFSAR
jgi:ABC-type nitrate/sulfonate/bicarbonate transport system permease component